MPPWKDFEILVAQIQQQTAPNAKVDHNQKIKGKSGRTRQLDVVMRTKVGLHEVMVVLECKRHKRRVGIEKVEAFANKLKDVGAHQGAMVSPKGFDAGAIAAAKEHNIGLWSYREALDADWEALFKPTAWVHFTVTTIARLSAEIRLKGGNRASHERTATVLDAKRQPLFALNEVIAQSVNRFLQLPPEDYAYGLQLRTRCFIQQGNELQEIDAIELHGRNRAVQYVFNLGLSAGHILQRVQPAGGAYQQVYSEPWRTSEIMATQAGRELSVEEWHEALKAKPDERKVMNVIADTNMRFRLAVRSDQTGQFREPTAN